jgi:hypothetical protein
LTIEQFLLLSGNTSIDQEPMSAGRQMGGHFATHSLNEDGSWKNLTNKKNSSADISPTAGQMPFIRSCTSIKNAEQEYQ